MRKNATKSAQRYGTVLWTESWSKRFSLPFECDEWERVAKQRQNSNNPKPKSSQLCAPQWITLEHDIPFCNFTVFMGHSNTTESAIISNSPLLHIFHPFFIRYRIFAAITLGFFVPRRMWFWCLLLQLLFFCSFAVMNCLFRRRCTFFSLATATQFSSLSSHFMYCWFEIYDGIWKK